jgi:hypothetical protein
MGKDGEAAKQPVTVLQNFDATVKAHGDKPALYQKVVANGSKPADTKWTMWTWKVQCGVKALVKARLRCD